MKMSIRGTETGDIVRCRPFARQLSPRTALPRTMSTGVDVNEGRVDSESAVELVLVVHVFCQGDESPELGSVRRP